MKIEKVEFRHVNEYRIFINDLSHTKYCEVKKLKWVKSLVYSVGILFIFTNKDQCLQENELLCIIC